MKAREITAASLEALRSGKYDMVRCVVTFPPSSLSLSCSLCSALAAVGTGAAQGWLLLTLRCVSACPQHRVNYANPDMVGHTGSIPATIQAVETCDAQASRQKQSQKFAQHMGS